MTINQTSNCNSKKNIAFAAIIAGGGLLIMAILAPIAQFGVFDNLVVIDNAAQTLTNIEKSEGSFRLGIGFLLFVVILDIVVAWALYIFLKQTDEGLALLSAWLRIIYAAMLGASLFNLLNVLYYLDHQPYLSALSGSQLEIAVMTHLKGFSNTWEFGLIIFGVHLLILGFLVYKAGYMSRALGILLLITALGYIVDGMGKILISGYNINISMYTFIGEVIFLIWLLWKGINDIIKSNYSESRNQETE